MCDISMITMKIQYQYTIDNTAKPFQSNSIMVVFKDGLSEWRNHSHRQIVASSGYSIVLVIKFKVVVHPTWISVARETDNSIAMFSI